jgi:hypothetical protein
VRVKVSLAGSNGHTYSLANVVVNVLDSPPLATLTGGSMRIVSQMQPLVMDASRSVDVDFPESGADSLIYRWTCMELSPSYGSPCAQGIVPFEKSQPSIDVAAYTLGLKNYTITVFVSTARGATASASQVRSVQRVLFNSTSIAGLCSWLIRFLFAFAAWINTPFSQCHFFSPSPTSPYPRFANFVLSFVFFVFFLPAPINRCCA